jgi:hypothetical protein
MNQTGSKKPISPVAIAFVGIFFTFAPALALTAYNYGVFHKRAEAIRFLVLGLVSTLLLIGTMYLFDDMEGVVGLTQILKETLINSEILRQLRHNPLNVL